MTMPQTTILTADGKEGGTVDLAETLFAAPVNESLIHQAVVQPGAGLRRLALTAVELGNLQAKRGEARSQLRALAFDQLPRGLTHGPNFSRQAHTVVGLVQPQFKVQWPQGVEIQGQVQAPLGDLFALRLSAFGIVVVVALDTHLGDLGLLLRVQPGQLEEPGLGRR